MNEEGPQKESVALGQVWTIEAKACTALGYSVYMMCFVNFFGPLCEWRLDTLHSGVMHDMVRCWQVAWMLVGETRSFQGNTWAKARLD